MSSSAPGKLLAPASDALQNHQTIPLRIGEVLMRSFQFYSQKPLFAGGAIAIFALASVSFPSTSFLFTLVGGLATIHVVLQHRYNKKIIILGALWNSVLCIPTVLMMGIIFAIATYIGVIVFSYLLMWVMALAPLFLTQFLPTIGKHEFEKIVHVMLILFLCGLSTPFILFTVRWSVAIPASLANRAGPFTSFHISRQLTKGQRWRILGLILVVSGGIVAISVILAQMTNYNMVTLENMSIPRQLIDSVMASFVFVALAMLYDQLSICLKGIDGEEIVKVFD